MPYYPKNIYNHIGYQKSKTKNKMYDALLQNIYTNKIVKVPFGSVNYQNYKDATGLNLYPHLIHNDPKRRKNFRARHKGFLKSGYWSPSYFSYYILW